MAFHRNGQRTNQPTNQPINVLRPETSDLGGKREEEGRKEEAEFLYHSLPKGNSILVYYL